MSAEESLAFDFRPGTAWRSSVQPPTRPFLSSRHRQSWPTAAARLPRARPAVHEPDGPARIVR
jgi:hypothetical protein